MLHGRTTAITRTRGPEALVRRTQCRKPRQKPGGLVSFGSESGMWERQSAPLPGPPLPSGHKKDPHDPDNHNGVIAHLEPDILESEVKWASGSITMNKASGGDGIPVELLQVLKDDAVKVLHSVCQQIWKTQQWPQDWKRSTKERQCQRMFKLPHNYTHFTC